MPRTPYLTAPPPSDKMPPGVPYIVGNEAAERFSFYGMKAILVVYMTKYLHDSAGQASYMSEAEAKTYMHAFVASAYFFPIAGAVLSDWLWGKYRTILALSLVYCLGHLALAVVPGREGLLAGLLLIAIGAGGIKPCVSAHVGDQFGEKNRHLLEKVFGWFYLSINLGALLSTLLTPWLLESTWMLERFGPTRTHQIAFGVPGVLMFLATLVFWMGRHRFVHVPPGGPAFFRELLSDDGLSALVRLIPLYLFVSVFWALYDQTGSAWVLQAEKMDRHILWPNLSSQFPWFSFAQQNVLAAAIQAVNPFLILLLVPLFSYVIYPACGMLGAVTPLRKVATGFFLIAAAFAISGWIQHRIDGGEMPSAYWQILAYIVLTSAEVLEFSYTQAPKRMKSLVMSLYLLSVSLGNVLTSGVNWVIQQPGFRETLKGEKYYWFFTGLMLLAAVAFIPYAMSFRGRTVTQDEASGAA
jgi:POT family proton-dependent oligopeptide transporter